jgi:dihydrofolate synthase/folylpolyglutamate synthase
VVVLETGMGGRLDATNVVTPLVSIITPIALDHEQWLGRTLGAIAAEKAGIIKRGVPVGTAVQAAEAAEVLQKRAHEQNAVLEEISAPWRKSRLGLRGPHQAENAALAVLGLKLAGFAISDAEIEAGLAEAVWPARFQVLGRYVIDGAHNPAGAAVLAESWREAFPGERPTLIFSAVATKDLTGVLRAILPWVRRVLVVPVHSARAVPTAALADAVASIAPDLDCVPFPGATQALQLAQSFPERILCAGSLYLCGEVLAILQSQSFEVSEQ